MYIKNYHFKIAHLIKNFDKLKLGAGKEVDFAQGGFVSKGATPSSVFLLLYISYLFMYLIFITWQETVVFYLMKTGFLKVLFGQSVAKISNYRDKYQGY